MRKLLQYSKYLGLPMKVRMSLLQEALVEKGYDINITGKRDKNTVKALSDFQKRNSLTPNGVVCEKTYSFLKIKNQKRKEEQNNED